MSKVVGAISMSLVLASAGAAWSQEIGIVSAAPNAATGELVVDIPARPDGEKVYIVREGTLVTEATVKSSGGQGGTILSLPAGTPGVVQVGDRVSLSPTLAKELPASAYDIKVAGDILPPSPGQKNLAATSKVVTQKTVTTEVGAPEPPPGPPGPPPPHAEQLEKTETRSFVHTVSPIMAEPTPRGMGVPLFPAPAEVHTEAGITAPYGQGLAAAAPVGTPYLRSPAFAGPPVIYMPQTVTRVLLPGATPYPSNIMSPPAQYVYASAPFLRTDIYTSLPYGTFYWPQGYAGTTPVEPQVPAYVTAPASAIMSTEADYSAGRYAPGVANEETLNPITSGINANLVASTTLGEESGLAATVSTNVQEPYPPLTVVQPGPEAAPSVEAPIQATEVNPFPVLSDTTLATPVPTPISAVPALPPVPAMAVPTPAVVVPTPVLPALPTSASTSTDIMGLPDLPAVPGAAAATPGLPALPAANTQIASALPNLPTAAAPATTTVTPASMMPSLPTPAVPPAPANVIVVDNSAPGAVTLDPPAAWIASANTAESHEGGSVTAAVDPAQVKKATFNASIPADGQYEVALWWVGGVPQFRSNSVPVTVNTATGPQQATIDQTQTGQWHVLGTYQFKAGQNVPILTVSTQGITPSAATVSVSVDAMRLTPQ